MMMPEVQELSYKVRTAAIELPTSEDRRSKEDIITTFKFLI